MGGTNGGGLALPGFMLLAVAALTPEDEDGFGDFCESD